MNQVNTLRIIIAWTFIVIAHAQFKYLCEFLDPKVFAKCEEYPENFLDQFLNMSELSIQQTTEGDLLVNGSIFVTKTLPNDLPVVLETYKKERGTWQPTVFTSKRSSLCKATFDNTEVWASYWENTPKEQQSCPLTEGIWTFQRR
ncbi:uncharacterized protein LOC142239011 isoform X2 [Haematobia irritans]|uniref:uncharacterized protein LOC142239011 isoform X2 n=1 Tax=Haematobia irritans TaxID=7368 RepID=UPI003F4FCF31